MSESEALDFYFGERNHKIQKKTKRMYKSALLELLNHSNKSISDINANDVWLWLWELNQSKLKANTINNKLTALSSIYKYFASQSFLLKNPMSNFHWRCVDILDN
jgi:site-specific recombinase XerD